MSKEFTRQALYDLVWSAPIIQIAKSFGMSDVGFAKTCKSEGIPLPPRGYWAKVSAGRRAMRIELPARGFGESNTVTVGRGSYYGYHTQDWEADLPDPPTYPETNREVIDRAKQVVAKIKIPKSLADAHTEIANALKADEEIKAKLQTEKYFYDKPKYDTSEAKRKLKILNGIFCGLQWLGYRSRLIFEKDVKASVFIGVVGVDLTFEALLNKSKKVEENKEKFPKFFLKLIIETRYQLQDLKLEWQESAESNITDHLREICAVILAAAEFCYRARAQEHYDWLVKQKNEHKEEKRRELARIERERLERIRKLEQKKQQKLFDDVSGWRKADKIRAFVAAVNDKNNNNLNELAIERLLKWTNWALAQADLIDPMNRTAEELMKYLWEELDQNK